MIKTENTVLLSPSQWDAIIVGMRNPKNSWKRSDSYWESSNGDDYLPTFQIGNNDLKLMKTLVNGGPVHAKFRRMIVVYVDITAPLYWWKEFDTYKVATVRNSCSTMHKIASKEFTLKDFSIEHLDSTCISTMENIIESLNWNRQKFLETKDKKYWWHLIQLLPSSYNQRSTIMLNYEVLSNMYRHRQNHKLDEWKEFCQWIESLPYAKELIIGEKGDEING